MTTNVCEDLCLQSELTDRLAICGNVCVRQLKHGDVIHDLPLRDCSEAAGLVSSIYSTPNASNALAIAILVLVSKNALANCSPSATVND